MDEIFDEKNEQKVEYNNIKFGAVGDWFKGTLTDNTRQIPNNLSQKKEMQTVFEFKAKGGSFHDIVKRKVDEKPTEIKAGEMWSFITGKPAMLMQLKNAKLGQIVGLRFSELKEATQAGWDDAKIIKVYLGAQDPDFGKDADGF
jgi:hypothetical protein